MITLYGISMSNYYNKVKLTLLEKGVAFTEEMTVPSQEPTLLQKSPIGKIPFIKNTETGGYLAESPAIIEYIEAIGPKENRLLPDDPWQAAQVRALSSAIDLYIDGPIRPVLSAAVFGGTTTPDAVERAQKNVACGIQAIKRMAQFNPYIAGSEMSYADITAITIMPLASTVLKRLTDKDPYEDWSQLHNLFEILRKRPHVQKVEADMAGAFEAFMARRK